MRAVGRGFGTALVSIATCALFARCGGGTSAKARALAQAHAVNLCAADGLHVVGRAREGEDFDVPPTSDVGLCDRGVSRTDIVVGARSSAFHEPVREPSAFISSVVYVMRTAAVAAHSVEASQTARARGCLKRLAEAAAIRTLIPAGKSIERILKSVNVSSPP
jgi:hypothetical protein